MIAQSRAIVLRVQPYSRTSHVVTWLSAEEGRLVTLIKGACRPRSWFLGQYDLFYTCDLLYYAREHHRLAIARECVPLCARTELRADWRSAAAASYMCDLAARTSVPGDRHRDLFSLLEALLDLSCQRSATPLTIYWYEAALLRCLGLCPQFTSCAACGGELTADAAVVPARGGALCPACAHGPSSDLITVPRDVLALLRAWQRGTPIQAAVNTACTVAQLLALRRLLGVFLQSHLDVAADSRDIALRLVWPQRPQKGAVP